MLAFSPIRTAAPATSLLTRADAKLQCHIDGSDEDALVDALIATAEGYLDGYSGVLGRALVSQTWSQTFDAFPAGRCLRLPLGNLQSVVSVDYFDSANQSRSFTGFDEASDCIGPMLLLSEGATWPATYSRPDAVTVEWDCGYGDLSDVPAPIIHAARLLIAHLHDSRSAVAVGAVPTTLPMGVDMLLAPYRMVGI